MPVMKKQGPTVGKCVMVRGSVVVFIQPRGCFCITGCAPEAGVLSPPCAGTGRLLVAPRARFAAAAEPPRLCLHL